MTEPRVEAVQQVHPRPDDPNCHVCGAQMVPSGYKCLSCGKVEAGDRALETARKFIEARLCPPFLHGDEKHQDWLREETRKWIPALADIMRERQTGDLAAAVMKHFDHCRCDQQIKKTPPCLYCQAALIQSAMNAQERELREALGKVAAILQGCDLETDFYLDSRRPSQRYVKQQMIDWLAEAERLLAERGEGA